MLSNYQHLSSPFVLSLLVLLGVASRLSDNNCSRRLKRKIPDIPISIEQSDFFTDRSNSSLIGYKVSGEKPHHRLFVNGDGVRKETWDKFSYVCSHILSESDTLKTLLSCIFTVHDLKELPPSLLIRMTHVISLTVGNSKPIPVANYAPTTTEVYRVEEKIWEDQPIIPLAITNNCYYPPPLKGQPVRAWLQTAPQWEQGRLPRIGSSNVRF